MFDIPTFQRPSKRKVGSADNEVRIQLSVLSYNLGNLWRRPGLPRRHCHVKCSNLDLVISV